MEEVGGTGGTRRPGRCQGPQARKNWLPQKGFKQGAASVKNWSGAAVSIRWACPPPPGCSFSFEEQDYICLAILYLESLNKPFRPWQTTAHLIPMGELLKPSRLLNPKSVCRRPLSSQQIPAAPAPWPSTGRKIAHPCHLWPLDWNRFLALRLHVYF